MTGGSGSTSQELTSAELLEVWKKTVDVQQHFNDIEWRIRGLALTVMTFTLGAAGLAAREGSEFWHLSLALLVLVVGSVLWLAFYVVDKVWYHPLLIGAVKHGTALETALGVERAGLTHAISKASPYRVPRVVFWVSLARRRERAKHVESEVSEGRPGPDRAALKAYARGLPSELHSDDKLRVFYGLGAAALLLAACAFQVHAMAADEKAPTEDPQEVVVRIDVNQPSPAPTESSSSPTTSHSAPDQ